MNRFLKGFAISAAVALFAIASAGVASAGDHGYGKRHGGKYYGGQHGGQYGGKHYYGLAGIVGHLLYGGYSYGYRYGNSYRYGDNYGRGHGYSRRHDHRRHGHYGRTGYRQIYRQNYRPQQGYKTHGYAVVKPCHATYKHGYAHGRRAKIGGTLCYDNYGNAYIVAGSRHVVGYY